MGAIHGVAAQDSNGGSCPAPVVNAGFAFSREVPYLARRRGEAQPSATASAYAVRLEVNKDAKLLSKHDIFSRATPSTAFYHVASSWELNHPTFSSTASRWPSRPTSLPLPFYYLKPGALHQYYKAYGALRAHWGGVAAAVLLQQRAGGQGGEGGDGR